MSELHRLLTDAVRPVEPPFDEADVRARVERAERHNRLVVSSVAALAVLVVTGVAVIGVGLDRQTDLVDESPPAIQWPATTDFLGVEIAVDTFDGPTEPLEHHVGMGRGTAALTTMPSDALQPGNATWQRVQHRLWFTCGDDQVVRMVETGRAEGAPEFTIAGPTGRWLPAGALIEAGRQLASSRGCEATAPAGAPPEVQDAQTWVGELAAAMEAAGLTTCCANPSSDQSNDWYLNDWGVLLGGDERLSLSVARRGRPPFAGDQLVEVIDMAGGTVLRWSETMGAVEFVCGNAHVLAYPTSGREASVEPFIERIGCTPSQPTVDEARQDLPELRPPSVVGPGSLHDPVIATFVDESMSCEEVARFAGFELPHAADSPAGTTSVSCYIEGHDNTGELPDTDALGGPEPFDVHVVYLPPGVSIQTHGYQSAQDAGAIFFSSRVLPPSPPGAPAQAIPTTSDPESSSGGYVAARVRDEAAVVAHILSGKYAVTWQEDGVWTQVRGTAAPEELLAIAQQSLRGIPTQTERAANS